VRHASRSGLGEQWQWSSTGIGLPADRWSHAQVCALPLLQYLRLKRTGYTCLMYLCWSHISDYNTGIHSDNTSDISIALLKKYQKRNKQKQNKTKKPKKHQVTKCNNWSHSVNKNEYKWTASTHPLQHKGELLKYRDMGSPLHQLESMLCGGSHQEHSFKPFAASQYAFPNNTS